MGKGKIIVISIVVSIAVGGVLFMYSRITSPAIVPDISFPRFLSSNKEQSRIEELSSGIRISNPKRDSIQSLDNPEFDLSGHGAVWLVPSDIIFGIVDGKTAYAFPQRIMVWHEIVNIEHNGIAAAVTYSPLTGSVIGYYARNIADKRTFGVSGRLVNSNLVMYDRHTESYWPQIAGMAIKGPDTGQRLKEFPVTWTTWEKWQKVHSNTLVLSPRTGFVHNYGIDGDPYGSYNDRSGYYFDQKIRFTPLYWSDALPSKSVVIGIRDKDDNAVAITKELLKRKEQVIAELDGRAVTVSYDERSGSVSAVYADTTEWINAFDVMWFAWYAYYPDTELIK
jgi:hypothetical protein